MQLNDILSQLGRPVAYYPKLAEFLGSVTAAIFLCQFAYWSGKEKNKGEIFKTAEEIKKETGLTIKQQKTARKILKAKGYLKEELRGIPAKIHYVFDWDKISEDWGKFISEEENKEEKEEEADISNKEGSNKFGQKGQTSLAKRVKLDWPKGSNYTIDYYIDYTYIYKTEKQTKTPKSKVSNFIKKGNTTIFVCPSCKRNCPAQNAVSVAPQVFLCLDCYQERKKFIEKLRSFKENFKEKTEILPPHEKAEMVVENAKTERKLKRKRQNG